MHGQLVAVLGGALDLVEVAEVDLRVDALREQIDAERDEVDIPGALAVAEEAALDAVGAGEVAELGGGDGGAAVVVGVEAQKHVLAVGEAPRHPLDRIGVDVGARHLDGGRQVDDDLAVGGRLEDLDDLIADLERELEFGPRVALGRVLVEDLGSGSDGLGSLAEPGPLEGDVDDALAVGAEDDVALEDARRVVEVHDRALGADDRLVGPRDEGVPGLGEHLDRDIVGDQVVVDEAAHEVEVGLTGAGEPDLDLLVAHANEQVEHDALALGAHRVDEGLVTVAQIHGAPTGRMGDVLRRPGAVRQFDGERLVVGTVLMDRHGRRLLGVLHGLGSCSLVMVSHRRTPRRGRPFRTRRGS